MHLFFLGKRRMVMLVLHSLRMNIRERLTCDVDSFATHAILIYNTTDSDF